jgi:hypothetical protein
MSSTGIVRVIVSAPLAQRPAGLICGQLRELLLKATVPHALELVSGRGHTFAGPDNSWSDGMNPHPRLVSSLVASILIAICCIPLVARAEALRVFAWRADTAAAIPGVVAMVWANPASFAPGTSGPSAKPATDVAKAVATKLHQNAPGSRALIISYAGMLSGPGGDPPLFPRDERLIQAYAIGGFTSFTTEWMTSFWQSLKAAGETPDFIVLDYEDAAGIWGFQSVPQPNAMSITGAPKWAANIVASMEALDRQLGASPTGYAPLDYVKQKTGWQWNVTAVDAFNRWFTPRRSSALRTSIFQPAWRAFGAEIATANYGEQRRAWAGVDSNGWVLDDQAISGTWSSPPTYLLTTGGRYSSPKDPKLRDSVRALQWLDRRNDVRAAFAVSANVAPWYSDPDFGLEAGEDQAEHRLRWAAGLLADRSIGVSTIFLWSDKSWTDDEVKFAKPILDYLATMTSNQVVPIERSPDSSAQGILSPWLDLTQRILSPRPKSPTLITFR